MENEVYNNKDLKIDDDGTLDLSGLGQSPCPEAKSFADLVNEVYNNNDLKFDGIKSLEENISDVPSPKGNLRFDDGTKCPEAKDFAELVINNNYEIAFVKDGEYVIRKKGKTRHGVPYKPIKIWTNKKNGNQSVTLNQGKYYLHRVLAKQYLPNPDNLPEVTHIDKDNSNNKLVNLKWSTSSENKRNRSNSSIGDIEYNYIDELSDEAVEVTNYGKHKFKSLYYDKSCDKFFYYNGATFRELHVNVFSTKSGSPFVNVRNIENKPVQIYLNKFKKSLMA